MTRTKFRASLAGAVVAALAALAVSACGGSGGGATAATTPPKTANGATATVGVSNSSLGKILVDSRNRTLYLFQKDSGGKSACFGACAGAWPPLRATGKPTSGSGTNPPMLGTIKRSDGKPQVTYNGHPLYLYQGDQKAGDTNGQGLTAFGGSWFAVSPAGNQVTGTPSNSGGGGY
jgi:predicted lipoprotein with Yx(FWY)xxD motif